MADVQAFRGWRYDLGQVGSLSDVTAPPYDVISPSQQKELYERHPCNVIRLILNREEPGDESPEVRYVRAAEFVRHWKREGVLFQQQQPALYAYHQEFDWEGSHYIRQGFLGSIRLEEFGSGTVYPHEETMPGPKADRLALTKSCRMNLSPIFGLYPDQGRQVQDPLESAARCVTALQSTDEQGVVHTMWPVTDHTVIAEVRSLMADKPVYIADGHHRYETACNYRNWLQAEGQLGGESTSANFVLMHFVGMSDPGLAILPTHRLISGLPDLTADDVRQTLAGYCDVQDVGTGRAAALGTWEMMVSAGGQDVFGFGTGDGHWVFARLTDSSPMSELAPGQSDEWQALGVSLLHRFILGRLFADRFPDAEQTCRYVHLMDAVLDAQQQGTCSLAALVPPATIAHVEAIAAQFERMPPKSTYFYPKLLSGLVFHGLE